MFKFGLKIWSANKQWFSEAFSLFERGIIDFLELYLVPDYFSLSDFEIFQQNNIPITIHAPHTEHDFDVFNLNERNLAVWQNQVLKTADFLASRFIIMHSGIGDSKEIFQQESAKIKDPRLLIENMPKIGLRKKVCFGYSLKELRFIKRECGLNICLDLAHAFKSAISEEFNYKPFIHSLIVELEPFYFHISGGRQSSGTDEHLNLFEGDFDIKWLKSILGQLAKTKAIYLVFEVPKNKDGLKNDIRNIEYFKEI